MLHAERRVGVLQPRERQQRHARAGRGDHFDLLERFDVFGEFGLQAQHHVVLVQRPVHHRYLALAERIVQHRRNGGHADAQPRGRLAVDHEVDLAALVLDVGVHVRDLGDLRHRLLHLGHPRAQQLQVARHQSCRATG
ncbi:hypothetical protein G6F35_016118 [Rhizopus arrhizus]|nr:hypothetical protein G6F35_016118 [Rhizopus arrhizus]